VRNLFRKHVFTAWPQLSEKKAGDVTVGEITDVLRKMINNGIERNTAKLRSYLRAAYALAMQAANDPTVAATAHIFNLTNNPAASIPALSQFNKAGDRVLDNAELGNYMRRVENLESPVTRRLLLIALYLGGQRPTQLARLLREHLDLNAGTVMLLDPKGNRRAGPRQHILPVSTEVAAIFAPLLEIDNESGLIFTTNGKVPITTETASSAVADICKSMVEAGEARSVFSMRDIRRTCETMSAAMGISKDLRAQIQSHGLSGVQNRHYDRHEYMTEKRAALKQWGKKLTAISKAARASRQNDQLMAA
jgi:integrase